MRKSAEERKNEILDTADRLFAEKGFDGTSTNDILAAVGIARGGLYHHFKSKEEILDSLIDRYSDQIVEAARKVAADTSIPIIDRITRTILALNANHVGGGEIIRQMHKPQNALLHEKAQKAMLVGVPPILTELIQQGIDQRIFHTPYPYECMEMVVAYTNAVFDSEVLEMTVEDRAVRLRAFIFNIERLLGAKAGSLASLLTALMGDGNE